MSTWKNTDEPTSIPNQDEKPQSTELNELARESMLTPMLNTNPESTVSGDSEIETDAELPIPVSSGADDTTADDTTLDIQSLIDQHTKLLYGYAYRLCGSVSDAEDMTQQTFLIAHQKLSQLRDRSSAKAWLCAILRSCWFRSLRRRKPVIASDYEIELDQFLEIDLTEQSVDEQAIQKIIDELPDDYRMVLVMYYFEDLSYREIAEQLNVKIGTIMSRLSRAKERVKRRLVGMDLH